MELVFGNKVGYRFFVDQGEPNRAYTFEMAADTSTIFT
jgi:hypothetical protein